MPDYEDDWMNPKSSVIFSSKPKENKTEYLIERAHKQICFGNPGYIVEWRVWESFDTVEERDTEIKRLAEEHPMWHLRRGERNPYLESIGIYPPQSHSGIND